MAIAGVRAVVPTSISNTGGSASVTASGLVTFSGVESVSLNGVFSATYDNYWVVISKVGTVPTGVLEMRLRSAGSDASGSDYARNTLTVANTTISVTSNSSDTQARIGLPGGDSSGAQILILEPFTSRRTMIRSFDAATYDTSVDVLIEGARHNVASSYDGFSIRQSTAGRTHTGQVMVYGMVQ